MKKNSITLFFFLLIISSLDAMAQRREPRGGTINPGSSTAIHTAGVKLFETKLYDLYAYLAVNGVWCNSRNGAAVSLVFKVDDNYIITDDDAYKRRFEKEILPVIKQHCSFLPRIVIYNYIKGVRIGRNLKEYSYDDKTFPGYEKPLTVIIINIDQQGVTRYQKIGGSTSLADIRKEREREENQANKRQVAAQAAERERKEAEKVQQQREAEKEKIESKGGLEPTSKELAVAFTRFLKVATPTCPNLENMEVCKWAPNVVIRLKGGEKKTCKPVVAGIDYHCEYSVEFECAFLNPRTEDYETDTPAADFYCAMWTKKTHNTGVRRISDGWIAYRLDKNRSTSDTSHEDTHTSGQDNVRTTSEGTPCPKNLSAKQVFTLNNYVNTEIAIKRGDRITIRASGMVVFGAFAGGGGPQGVSFNPIYNYIKNLPHGSLIGRVKRSSGDDEWTFIGTGIVVVSQVDGILQLAVNDKEPQNNSGQFRVEVDICAMR